MVSVAVSKMGVARLFFVEAEVKVNGKYYWDVLLSQQMLSAIRHVADDNFVFQQNSAPAHQARDTIKLLQRETPDFISPQLWPSNSLDLIPIDYKIWGIMQQRVYEMLICNVDELRQRLVDIWSGRQQSVVDAAISKWRKHHLGVSSHEERTFRTSAVACFDNGMKH